MTNCEFSELVLSNCSISINAWRMVVIATFSIAVGGPTIAANAQRGVGTSKTLRVVVPIDRAIAGHNAIAMCSRLVPNLILTNGRYFMVDDIVRF